MANKYPWFSHYHDAHDDAFIQSLMDRFEHFGYAAYFIILELLHKDGTGDVLEISPARLCQKLRSRSARVRELLEFCRTSGKVDSEWSQDKVRIQIKKFREMQSKMKFKTIPILPEPSSNTPIQYSRGELENKREKKETPPAVAVSLSDFAEEEKETENGEPKAKATETAKAPRGVPSSFDAFWSVWRDKVGKEAARKEWKKIKLDSALQAKILDAAKKQWDRHDLLEASGKFVAAMKMPQGWLSGKRWNDEVESSHDPEGDRMRAETAAHQTMMREQGAID